jgi:hypothetical protein
LRSGLTMYLRLASTSISFLRLLSAGIAGIGHCTLFVPSLLCHMSCINFMRKGFWGSELSENFHI